MTDIDELLLEVADEVDRAEAKHPNQDDLADGTSPGAFILRGTDINLDLRTGRELADIFRRKCQRNRPHEDNWRDILLEEVFEAMAEIDPAKLRVELIQVAAVAARWIKTLDDRHDFAECECGHKAPRDQLHACANTIPGQRPPLHCDECLPDCGPCQDEATREWQDEHGIRSGRRH